MNQDIEATMARENRGDQRLARIPRCEVVGLDAGAAAGLADRRGHRLGRAAVKAGTVRRHPGVVDDHACAPLGEQACVGSAQPPTCPGDEHNLPHEVDALDHQGPLLSCGSASLRLPGAGEEVAPAAGVLDL